MKPLPFHRPTIDADDLKAVKECLNSGWLTTGPRAETFEREFARFVGGKYAVSVNSCTAAVHLALLALDVEAGDEVITTPITFASTVNMILHSGADPVFADVEPDRLTLDPRDVEKQFTQRTRIIMPVHFAGHPCDMKALRRIAKKRGIHVVADAAHAVEALYDGWPLGSMGDVVCYSFYANKNMTTGEGGMAVTGSRKLAERMKSLRLHGMTRDAWKRYVPGSFKHWDILEPGWKYNMSDIQAALGLSQLRKVSDWWKRRQALTRMYDIALKGVPGVHPLKDRPGDRPARHLYVILVDRDAGISRDQVIAGLQKRGIGIGVHFRAVHLTHHYSHKLKYRRGMCPVAEDASDRLLSLPLFPSMAEQDVERVVEALKDTLLEKVKGDR